MAILKVPNAHAQGVMALSGREGLITDKHKPRAGLENQQGEDTPKVRPPPWATTCKTSPTESIRCRPSSKKQHEISSPLTEAMRSELNSTPKLEPRQS